MSVSGDVALTISCKQKHGNLVRLTNVSFTKHLAYQHWLDGLSPYYFALILNVECAHNFVNFRA